ncbi:hypothetical protein A2U01_0071477 [Trifolium medium]|uniref:Uncharacterized protein n=1 Tax=Trifolium medium TaxID=97028 RepID=A0A392SMX1_9FABA|nr:hypothetical protein [Trifolium medium]
MITGPDAYIGHPFVITTLCRLEHVPTWDDTDEIAPAERPLGRTFFQRVVRDLQAAEAAAAAPQPATQHEQHQDPPHIPH